MTLEILTLEDSVLPTRAIIETRVDADRGALLKCHKQPIPEH